jgi:heparin binding hemagglutinin HbhA
MVPLATFPNLIPGFAGPLEIIWWVLLGLKLVALIDAALRPRAVFVAADKLTKAQTEFAKRFETLVADARTAPAKLRELPAVAQHGFTTVLGQAEETYEDLAGRGKDLVERIRSQKATEDFVTQAKTTVSKAKATRTTAKKTADSATRNVKATATSARKTAKTASKAATDAADTVGD